MLTLLQSLLLETLPADSDPILLSFIEKILPEMEKEYALIPAMGGGSEEYYLEIFTKKKDAKAAEKARGYSSKADQSLLVHVLNALLIAWNLIPYLKQPLSEIEKYLLCLALILHDYDKYCLDKDRDSPSPEEVRKIIVLCQELGKKLSFGTFWPEWEKYLAEIAYLAQNTQGKIGVNLPTANYPNFTIDSRRLQNPLCHLLAFGDIAVHLQDPAAIHTKTGGDRLRERLRYLKINKRLTYHRLRDISGILSNGIHNATQLFAKNLGWTPLLYFASGIVYLAPIDDLCPDREELKEFTWQQIHNLLSQKMLSGEVGSRRSGKGVKIAPQTLELIAPSEIISKLPEAIESQVRNEKDPATPKRLIKLSLSDQEKISLKKGADLRADQLAEYIIFVQRNFFKQNKEFIEWILQALELDSNITPQETQEQAGGVNYGWYRVAASYISKQSTLDLKQALSKLNELAKNLANWAEENNLLSKPPNSFRNSFLIYIDRYLEVSGWNHLQPNFVEELNVYINAGLFHSKNFQNAIESVLAFSDCLSHISKSSVSI